MNDHGQQESYNSTDLSITIAVVALNEEVLIEETVKSILPHLEKFFVYYEVILIDDGSQDNTPHIMEALARSHDKIKVIHNKQNLGLGASFQRVLQVAKFKYFMMLCGDGGMPAESLPPIFAAVGQADVVVPYITNLAIIKSKSRYYLSKVYISILNLIFTQKIRYYNGLPVYRADLLRAINIRSSGFGFQGEILTKLLKRGCSYIEVGVPGSEKANRSRAVSVKNFINVGRTFMGLLRDIYFTTTKPLPKS